MLNKNDVNNILDNSKFNLTLNEYEKIYEGYVKSMREEMNKSKNNYEQEQMILDIAFGVSAGENFKETLRRYQDSKAFNNAANRLGQKFIKGVEKAMDKYNFGTSAFIGVKFTTSEEGSTEEKTFFTNDGKVGKIKVKFEDWSKYQIENLTIEINGEEVYKYRDEIFKEFSIEGDDDYYEDMIQDRLDAIERKLEEKQKEIVEKNTKKGKIYNSSHASYVSYAVETKDNTYEAVVFEERIRKNGSHYWVNARTGRIVSYDDVEGGEIL